MIRFFAVVYSISFISTYAAAEDGALSPNDVDHEGGIHERLAQGPETEGDVDAFRTEIFKGIIENEAVEKSQVDVASPASSQPQDVKAKEGKVVPQEIYNYDTTKQPAKPIDISPTLPKDSKEAVKKAVQARPETTLESAELDKLSELGANDSPEPFRIAEIDDDEPNLETSSSISSEVGVVGHQPKYFRGRLIEDDVRRNQKVVYQYISRAGWLIKRIQPHYDRLAGEVIRADRSEIVSGFIELSRTFVFLASLLSTDDGSKEMEKKVAYAVSVHREALSQLRLRWNDKTPEVASVFESYMQATFFKDLNREKATIKAGELVRSKYETLGESNSDVRKALEDKELGNGAKDPMSIFKNK